MFNGIIRNLGTIKAQLKGSGHKLQIVSDLFKQQEEPIKNGDSIAVNGVCLTVVKIENNYAEFDLATETIRKTTLGDLKEGSRVNLERCLKVSDRIDGNLVQGHIDQRVKLLSKKQEENTIVLEFELPKELAHLIAKKGYVTLDGIALTVGDLGKNSFFVYIIPYTLSETNFKTLEVGDTVNLEVDSVARYVQRILEVRELGE